jgi:hypothetical protein
MLPEISGNAITAERWRQALVHKGLNVHVLATGHLDANNFLNYLENVAPSSRRLAGGRVLLSPRANGRLKGF